MSTYIYRPGHPYANERGLVKRDEYDFHRAMTTEDKWMEVGNRRVYIGYIPDEMPPTRHMCLPPGSKPYTSKKRFRDETRARNCVEVGNEASTLMKPRKYMRLNQQQRVDDIKRAIEIEKAKMPKKRKRKLVTT